MREPHATSIRDAFAGPNLISPDMYREFALEPERKLAKIFQDIEDSFFNIPYLWKYKWHMQDMRTTGKDFGE